METIEGKPRKTFRWKWNYQLSRPSAIDNNNNHRATDAWIIISPRVIGLFWHLWPVSYRFDNTKVHSKSGKRILCYRVTKPQNISGDSENKILLMNERSQQPYFRQATKEISGRMRGSLRSVIWVTWAFGGGFLELTGKKNFPFCYIDLNWLSVLNVISCVYLYIKNIWQIHL